MKPKRNKPTESEETYRITAKGAVVLWLDEQQLSTELAESLFDFFSLIAFKQGCNSIFLPTGEFINVEYKND